MLHKSSRRLIRRRYKRLAAVVAGAAMMSSALLPGLPTATIHASPRTHRNPQVAAADTNTTPTSGPTATTMPPAPTPNPTPAPSPTPTDPVQVVTANAESYGFNTHGKYTLMTQTGSHAVVRVRSNGETYKVYLVLQDGNWVIRDVRSDDNRGNKNIYTTDQTVLTPLVNQPVVPQTLAANQQILYQITTYDAWTWNENTYPQDLSVGVFLQNPLQGGIATPFLASALAPVKNIDYGRQFVVYAHLGTTASQGYGIGIALIAQTGNDLTVVVRTESPLPNLALQATKSDDFVPLDRAALNFNNPINITFVDQNGTILGKHTINPS